MRDLRSIAGGILVCGGMFLSLRTHAQAGRRTPAEPVAQATVIASSQTLTRGVDRDPSGAVVRSIDDLPLGHRWLLVRNEAHPGGPGRLVLASGQFAASVPGGPPAAPRRPVVHAGERLIVEEDTPVATARLEAVALGAAFAGEPFEVRLKAGGNRVRVVALGPGRAALVPPPAGQPFSSGVRP